MKSSQLPVRLYTVDFLGTPQHEMWVKCRAKIEMNHY